jgi:hypothetical protein
MSKQKIYIGGNTKTSELEIKSFEDYKLVNDSSYVSRNEAVEIVHEYIKKHKLILVGGQSLDFAFRLRNHKLYDKQIIADYDFYSPNHNVDAYNIGQILCNKGFENVSVINALHSTTMKVRVNFNDVADITFCPQILYDKLPTLNYNGINIISPYFQRIDLFISLANPFKNLIDDRVGLRFEKDLNRLVLLENIYPLSEIIDEEEKKIPILTPEEQEAQRYIPKHVFYQGLKGIKNDIKEVLPIIKHYGKLIKHNKLIEKKIVVGISAYTMFLYAFLDEFKHYINPLVLKSEPNLKMFNIVGDKNDAKLFSEMKVIKDTKITKYNSYIEKRHKYYNIENYNFHCIDDNTPYVVFDRVKIVNICHVIAYMLISYFEYNDINYLYMHHELIIMASASKNPIFNISINIDKLNKSESVKRYEKNVDNELKNKKTVKIQPDHFYPKYDNCNIPDKLLHFEYKDEIFELDGQKHKL